MIREFDVVLVDGRTLHAYDAGAADADGDLAVVWHHGTPNIGTPPAPLFPAAARLGLRWVSYDRPGYGGSTPHPGRDVASAAARRQRVWPTPWASNTSRWSAIPVVGRMPLRAGRCFRTASSGSPASPDLHRSAPRDLDWFAGMAASGVASLRAAAEGREAKEAHEASGDEYDPGFTPADLAALDGEWSWLGSVVGPAMANGPGALIDDDLAYVAPVGIRPRPSGSADALPAWQRGPRRAEFTQRVARQPLAVGTSCGCPRTTGTSRCSTPPPPRWSGCAERFREGRDTDVVPDASQNSGAGDYPVVVVSVGTEVAVGALVAAGVVVAVGSLVSAGSVESVGSLLSDGSLPSDGSLESVGSVVSGAGGVGSMTA